MHMMLNGASVLDPLPIPSPLAIFCLQVSWQVLGLSQLNAELHCPVTAAEVQAQHLADKGQLSNDNAASLLPPFQLDLGVAAAGGGSRQFWVEVTNDGVLPVEWELHSYDAPQVGVPYHCEEANNSTGLVHATDRLYVCPTCNRFSGNAHRPDLGRCATGGGGGMLLTQCAMFCALSNLAVHAAG